jgi:hypothetical protein
VAKFQWILWEREKIIFDSFMKILSTQAQELRCPFESSNSFMMLLLKLGLELNLQDLKTFHTEMSAVHAYIYVYRAYRTINEETEVNYQSIN